MGLLSFSEGRLRVHQTLEDSIRGHAVLLARSITRDPLLEAVAAGEIVHSSRLARDVALKIRASDIEAVIFDVRTYDPAEQLFAIGYTMGLMQALSMACELICI